MHEFTTINMSLFAGDERYKPTQAHDTDAGYDLRVREVVPLIGTTENDVMQYKLDEAAAEPNGILFSERGVLVRTGVFVGLQRGWEAQVRPRSGLALKFGLTVLNSPGTIDASYRGEVGVILFNTAYHRVQIKHLDRVAQLVFQRVPGTVIRIVDSLDETIRGVGGFGHTGVK